MLLPCKSDAILIFFLSLLCPHIIGTAAATRADKARRNRKPVQVRVRGCGGHSFLPSSQMEKLKINCVQFSLDIARANRSSWNRCGFCFCFLDSPWQNSAGSRFIAWNRPEPLWKRSTLLSAWPGSAGTALDLTRNPCPTIWTLNTLAQSQLEPHHRWDISSC